MITYYLESIFNPSEQNENIIAEYIDRATQSIDICMYIFTSKFLAMKLLEKSQQGVKIRIIADQTEAYQTYSVVGALKETSDWDIQIRLVKKARLHNKFMIVDKLYLLIGSMNFSFKSKHNYENGSFFYGKISSDYINQKINNQICQICL
ncbi:hypothetical protein PPERSA_03963 [Pseudocohnilembus persalinus]|uniref:Mitochondrial cardiolipin hydrolase n=1 Tax=Pseudocohnilembus persalinus TaxID=266149 RepID=A0A0V0QAJ7_PSEPJ|nr:hypothetical protein PPERSA_03963 [Pseudocohnilembus persalinus]|eukprot:KRW99257.1 hypothetical protein PPERSA_03963 [Pseudocohnilembus persalinus]